MFPIQLVQTKKSKDGRLKINYLDETSDDKAQRIVSAFLANTGNKKGNILEQVRELELELGSPKTIKGLAETMFLFSIFGPPTKSDPSQIRKLVFKIVGRPIYNPSERYAILKKIAEEEKLTPEEINDGMYGDLESEQILKSTEILDSRSLLKAYNLELFRTILSRCKKIEFQFNDNPFYLRSLLLSKGLEVEEDNRFVRVLSHPDNNAKDMLKIVDSATSLFYFHNWNAEAQIQLKRKKYIFSFYDSDRIYFPSMNEPLIFPPGKFIERNLKMVNENMFIIIFGGKDIGVIFSNISKRDSDIQIAKKLLEKGSIVEHVYHSKEKKGCPTGAYCFKDVFDFDDFVKYLKRRYSNNSLDSYGLKDNMEIIKETVEKLMPDNQAVFEYLSGRRLPVKETLESIGLTLKWKNGLPEIERSN